MKNQNYHAARWCFWPKTSQRNLSTKCANSVENTVGVLGPKDYAVNTDLPTKCANSVENTVGLAVLVTRFAQFNANGVSKTTATFLANGVSKNYCYFSCKRCLQNYCYFSCKRCLQKLLLF